MHVTINELITTIYRTPSLSIASISSAKSNWHRPVLIVCHASRPTLHRHVNNAACRHAGSQEGEAQFICTTPDTVTVKRYDISIFLVSVEAVPILTSLQGLFKDKLRHPMYTRRNILTNAV